MPNCYRNRLTRGEQRTFVGVNLWFRGNLCRTFRIGRVRIETLYNMDHDRWIYGELSTFRGFTRNSGGRILVFGLWLLSRYGGRRALGAGGGAGPGRGLPGG